MFRILKGIFDSEVAGQNLIGAQVNVYNDIKLKCPGDDPHILLAKVYMSRLSARRFDLNDPIVLSKCFAQTTFAACLDEGFNIRATAILILKEERPDIAFQYPKFEQQLEFFLQPLFEKMQAGHNLLNLYKRKNPNLQISREFPPGYAALLDLNEALMREYKYL